MHRRSLRTRHRRVIRPWHRAIAVLMVLVVFLFVCLVRCRQVVATFAQSNAAWMAEKTANETISRVLEEKAQLCRSLIQVSYNEQQILSSVILDAAGINIIKTAVSVAVMDALEDVSTIGVNIPLGTMLGLDWLSGWGPLIYIPMSMTSSVYTSISSTLDAVGINQSSYRVNVCVKVNMWIVTPAGYSDVTIETAVPMAETVLLGEVPDNLTEVYGDDQGLLGQIFDYGTIE